MKYQFLKCFISLLLLIGCNDEKDKNNLGTVEKLPPGEYVIYNYGSRHIVKCLKSNGEYYYLNDSNFELNGINGYDAHEYREKTKIVIK